MEQSFGALAANFDGVKDFQQKVLGTLDEINEKQDEIIESQKEVASDVKDIKEIVTGEAEIKQLSSTEDYTTFEQVNARTDALDQKTIAILYFDNSSNNPQLDPLKKGLADMLISDLSNLNMLRVVEREKLEDKILQKEKELNQLKNNINEFRRGNVVIKTGQTLFIPEINSNPNRKLDLAKIYSAADKYVQKIVIPSKKK